MYLSITLTIISRTSIGPPYCTVKTIWAVRVKIVTREILLAKKFKITKRKTIGITNSIKVKASEEGNNDYVVEVDTKEMSFTQDRTLLATNK